MSEMVAVYEEHLAEWLPQLIEAAGNTLRMTALAFVLAFIVGLLLALASSRRSLRCGWLPPVTSK